MKKFVFMFLLLFLMSGCSKTKQEHIPELMLKSTITESNCKDVLGMYDGKETNEGAITFLWNNYSLFKGHQGTLKLDFGADRRFFIWKWTILGNEKERKEIVKILSGQFEKMPDEKKSPKKQDIDVFIVRRPEEGEPMYNENASEQFYTLEVGEADGLVTVTWGSAVFYGTYGTP